MSLNPMTLTDGYKIGHKDQYPRGTTRVYSNWTPRGTRVPQIQNVVSFGLQYFIKEYMVNRMREFFADTRGNVEKRYAKRVSEYLGFPVTASHIGELHELGFMPLEFRALPEGTNSPLRVCQFTVENTDPRMFWLPNYIETNVSQTVWGMSTAATLAYRFRKMLNEAAEKTGAPKDFVQFQGHDFSMRGMIGLEASLLTGAGHLLSFVGTDTVPVLDFIDDFYPGDNGLVGCSVPASEHSVASAHSASHPSDEGECSYIEHMLNTYPTGIFSMVSDTYDLWKILQLCGTKYREQILARDGKVVFRPDSGDPVKILCGDAGSPPGTPQNKGVIQLLWEYFGGQVNAKSYRELNSHVGAIYGDAINWDRGNAICQTLQANGYASTNVVFGIGSFTYQYNTRDTFGFAMKATWAEVDGKGVDLFKKPITDTGEKFSAKGRLAVLEEPSSGTLCMVEGATPEQERQSLLLPVWRNGRFLKEYSFAACRRNLWG